MRESCTRPVRTLVVDDAPLMRRAIPEILNKYPEIEVVGTAANGQECLAKILELSPHVVTLDIDMPVMNGITTIKNIMVRHQIPIVIISSMIQDGYFAFEALRLGVVDFVPKPSGASSADIVHEEELICKRVRAASEMHVQCVRRVRLRKKPTMPSTSQSSTPSAVVAVGTTLAGPNTIMHILSHLEDHFSGAIVCLQEIHPKILASFSSRFSEITALEVVPVISTCPLRPGTVYMASTSTGVRIEALPGDPSEFVLQLAEADSPIDKLFQSAAVHFGENSCGVLLSGVGTDGAEGLRKIKEHGGLTLAQQQDCCVYPNLVQHAVEQEVVDNVLPESAISNCLDTWIKSR